MFVILSLRMLWYIFKMYSSVSWNPSVHSSLFSLGGLDHRSECEVVVERGGAEDGMEEEEEWKHHHVWGSENVER